MSRNGGSTNRGRLRVPCRDCQQLGRRHSYSVCAEEPCESRTTTIDGAAQHARNRLEGLSEGAGDSISTSPGSRILREPLSWSWGESNPHTLAATHLLRTRD